MGGNMDAQALIIWLIVGAIAGWLAGMAVKGAQLCAKRCLLFLDCRQA